MITLSTIFSRRGGKGLAGVAGLALMVGAMFVTSCDKDDNDSDTPATRNTITLSAAMEQPSGDTKTQLNSTTVIWSAGDEIKVYDNADNPKVSTLTAGSSGKTSTNFTGEEPDGYLTPSYAIYPASAATGCNSTGTITFTLPATQSYVANSFGNGCNIAVGKVENDAIAFKNVCGYLKLQLKLEEGYAFTVGKIVLKGNSNEKLNGTFSVDASNTTNPTATTSGTPTAAEKTITLDCGDGVALSATEATNFYFVVPVNAFATSGFTAEIYNTTGVLKSSLTVTNKQNTINRSMVRVMPEKNLELMSLPVGYTECEYIESSGTQYINTGITYTDNITFSGRLAISSGTSSSKYGFFGYRCIESAKQDGNMKWFLVYGDGKLGVRFGVNGDDSTSKLTAGTAYNIEFDGTNLKVDNVTYVSVTGTYSTTDFKNAYLFSCNMDGYYSEGISKFCGKIYYFNIYDDGVLVRDFVPAMEKSDNVYGMYDLISKTFFTNQGTGSFTGQVVTE